MASDRVLQILDCEPFLVVQVIPPDKEKALDTAQAALHPSEQFVAEDRRFQAEAR
jgi:hypothetical protein